MGGLGTSAQTARLLIREIRNGVGEGPIVITKSTGLCSFLQTHKYE